MNSALLLLALATVPAHAADYVGGNWGGANLVLNNGDTVVGSFTNVGTVQISGTVTVLGEVYFYADTIQNNGVLTADGQGSPGGGPVQIGTGLGGGLPGAIIFTGDAGGGGAGYVGLGGSGGLNGTGAAGAGGTDWFNPGGTQPVAYLGSGGGGADSSGGAPGSGGSGGGIIWLEARTIDNSGTFSARGATPSYGTAGGGGGSGGTIVCIANELLGYGLFDVTGGDGGSATVGGGGGSGGLFGLLVGGTLQWSAAIAAGNGGVPFGQAGWSGMVETYTEDADNDTILDRFDNCVNDANQSQVDADLDGKGDACDPCPNLANEADVDRDGYWTCDDCDDSEPLAWTNATEVCDGVDNDCSGMIDGFDAVDATTYYRDLDGDTYGDPNVPAIDCSAPPGFVLDNSDCDDSDDNSFPNNIEICDSGDNDCNGLVDDYAQDSQTFFVDNDLDGYGTPNATVQACFIGPGVSLNDLDCDDSDVNIKPYADEVCDGVDNNCDTLVDDADPNVDLSTGTDYYVDLDQDGFGDPNNVVLACDPPPGTVADNTDCNDYQDTEYPGAPEIPDDGIDQDCDGSDLAGPSPDTDGDGLTDEEEAALGTNPNRPDTDGDGALDGADPDPLNPGNDGKQEAEATAKPAHGFGFGCSHTPGGPPGWLWALPLLMGARRRQPRSLRASQ